MHTINDKNSLLYQVPSVAVIMSTYNGEKYLSEQIDSILAQKDVHVELFIRDDGSQDSTREIISEYADKYDNVHAEFGGNIGCRMSFIHTLASVPEFDYYAFSDQDDYWKQEKLITAVNAIQQKEAVRGKDILVLWYSNLYVADEALNIIRKTKLDKRILSLEGMTLRQSLAGCTMVMNSALRKIIVSKVTDDIMKLFGHDRIEIPLVLASGGELICDSNAYIYYRQHGKNLVGSPSKLIPRIKYEWKHLINGHGLEEKRAKLLLQVWGDEFTPNARKILRRIANYRENWLYRLEIVFSPKFRTGDTRLTLLMKFKALLGKL